MGEDSTQPEHEHLYRVVFSNKMVVRFCERCGQSWVIAEFHELITQRSVYAWTPVLEEDEVQKRIAGGD